MAEFNNDQQETELNDEQLEQVAGGYWNRDTITTAEREELEMLVRDFNNGANCFQALDGLINRLNKKYGGDRDINEFIG